MVVERVSLCVFLRRAHIGCGVLFREAERCGTAAASAVAASGVCSHLRGRLCAVAVRLSGMPGDAVAGAEDGRSQGCCRRPALGPPARRGQPVHCGAAQSGPANLCYTADASISARCAGGAGE